MNILNISIRNKTHQIACESGDQERILKLAENFNDKVNEVAAGYPNASELTLYFLASLMLQDENNNEISKINALKQKNSSSNVNVEKVLADALNTISEQLEIINDQIKNK
jgi:cell division protein ZapA